MKGLGILATMLTVASGCDKARELVPGARAASGSAASAGPALDLASKPHILFQVFGERTDARMIPVAALDGGTLKLIHLSPTGWKQFDAIYLHSGLSYRLFQDGQARGTVRVRQGMWERDGQPLYDLQGCGNLTPLAAVRLDASLKASFAVELFASSAELGRAPPGRAPSAAEVARITRELGARAAADAGVPRRSLDSLDFFGTAIATGAGSPTMISSFIDPTAANPTASSTATTHIFVIADAASGGVYTPTFTHVVSGPLAGAEFRRYVDHLDVTGDGIDEIFLVGWLFGGDTFLSVLGYQGGRWVEVFRGRSNWCLDVR